MRLFVVDNKDNSSKLVANYICDAINNHNKKNGGKPFVIGLPTGGTAEPVYKYLVERYKAGKVSFANVVSFNMDEYVGLSPSHNQSYRYFMENNFFKHVDIKPENTHVLDGLAKDVEAECEAYEKKIESFGGIDLFFGGVGEDGHIAFNEPGSSLSSRTRVKELTEETIDVNSRFFDKKSDVPTMSLTVGVGTICDAREVIILANGPKKARAVHHAVEGSVSHAWTITALQMHKKATIVVDEGACDDLKLKTYKYYKFIEHDTVNKYLNQY